MTSTTDDRQAIDWSRIARLAHVSPCGLYRWTLYRGWNPARSTLLVIMFNPSVADASIDDPTIKLVCQIADHNGYGSIQVVNAIPLRGSTPELAIMLGQSWANDLHHKEPRSHSVETLHQNLEVIRHEAAKAGAVLLGWGALGARCPQLLAAVLGVVADTVFVDQTVYSLGKTKGGHPIHPLARGKLKVRPDAVLVPWSDE